MLVRVGPPRLRGPLASRSKGGAPDLAPVGRHVFRVEVDSGCRLHGGPTRLPEAVTPLSELPPPVGTAVVAAA
eukprot:10424051-Heterocapsa_arctica.AAC.1